MHLFFIDSQVIYQKVVQITWYHPTYNAFPFDFELSIHFWLIEYFNKIVNIIKHKWTRRDRQTEQ